PDPRPVSSIAHRELIDDPATLTAGGAGLCVGRPVGDIEIRIVTITDDPLERWDDALCVEAGTIGEICVRGPVVTRAYFRRDASTRQAKILAGDGTFFHRMGDVGYLDASGRLWFCGRKAHRV